MRELDYSRGIDAMNNKRTHVSLGLLLVLPALYALRHTWFYRRAVLLGGSCVIAAIAAGWFLERAFAWRIPGLS